MRNSTARGPTYDIQETRGGSAQCSVVRESNTIRQTTRCLGCKREKILRMHVRGVETGALLNNKKRKWGKKKKCSNAKNQEKYERVITPELGGAVCMKTVCA